MKATVRGSLWSGTATLVSLALQSLQLLVVARAISPGEYGLLAVAGLVIALSQVFIDGGMTLPLIQRREIGPRDTAAVWWLCAGTGVSLAAAMALGGWAVGLTGSPLLGQLLAWSGVPFLFGGLGQVPGALLRREMRFGRIVAGDMAGAIGGTAATIAWILTGHGIVAVAWGAAVGAAIRLVAVCMAAPGPLLPAHAVRWADLPQILAFGGYQIGERLLSFASFRLDQMVIGFLSGEQALGLYAFAWNLVVLPMMRVSGVANGVLMPAFCRIQDDDRAARTGYLMAVRLLAALSAPALLGFAACAPQLVPLAFGAQWGAAVPVIQILCVFALLRTLISPVGALVLSRGHARLNFLWHLGYAAASLPALAIGAAVGGVLGVAVAATACMALNLVAHVPNLLNRCIGPAGRDYAGRVSPPAALASVMALAVWWGLGISDPAWPRLIAGVACGAALYGLGTLILLPDLRRFLPLRR